MRWSASVDFPCCDDDACSDGAEGGTRTPTSYLTRPSNVRVYQFRHFGSFGKKNHSDVRQGFSLFRFKRQTEVCRTSLFKRCAHFLVDALGEGVIVVDVGTATGAAGVGVACVAAAGVGDASGA